MTVPTAWKRLSMLTQANSLPLREQQEITAAEPSNNLSVDSPQGEAEIFEHATNNVAHNELDQDPLDPFQGAAGDNDPVAHQTREKL